MGGVWREGKEDGDGKGEKRGRMEV